MNTQNNIPDKRTLNKAEIIAINGAFNAYQFQAANSFDKKQADLYDFNIFAWQVKDLMSGLAHINASWNDEIRGSNFIELQIIFDHFIQQRPDMASQTFRLYAVITRLISKILERDKAIQTLENMFAFYGDIMGNDPLEAQAFPNLVRD